MPYSAQRRVTSSVISSAHLDLARATAARPPPGHFAVASMPSLPPKNWQLGRVVEVVERALREDHVALRVDVRAGVEEDLLVVVHVDVLVHDDDALRQASIPSPQIACITFAAWPGNGLRIETMQQLWKTPATGRS